jgi:putative ABC transport system permease protein
VRGALEEIASGREHGDGAARRTGEAGLPAAISGERGASLSDAVFLDVRFGFRALRGSPGPTAVSVAVLALGIGVGTAIFGVVEAVLLAPLPIVDQDRIVVVEKRAPADDGLAPFQQADVLAYAGRTGVFESVAGVQYDGAFPYGWVDDGRPLTAVTSIVSGDFFEMLGMRPAAGRLFRPEDDDAGRQPVAVVSHGFWMRHHGGNPAAVGRALRSPRRPEGIPVVGVAPAGFEYPRGVEVWVTQPLPADAVRSRSFAIFSVIGRLEPGSSPEDAREEATSFLREREATVYSPGETTGHRVRAATLHEAVVGDVRPLLLALSGGVALVLLVAAANVAGLLLLRATERQKELAVRTALGASRGRATLQLLVEGALLAAAGGAAGVLVALGTVPVLVALAPPGIPRLDRAAVGGGALAFALAVSASVVVLSALAPALWASRADPFAALRTGASNGPEARTVRWTRQALVAAQVAVAVLVVVGASLLVRSLARLERVEMGFDSEGLRIAHVPLTGPAYDDPAARLELFERLVARVEAAPGIEAATPLMGAPFLGEGGWTATYTAEGQDEAGATANPTLTFEAVLPGYFRAFGVPVARGRPIEDGDGEGSVPVAVVSESLARRAWPGEDPIGRRLKLGAPDAETDLLSVVGVVPDTRYRDLVAPSPTIYVALRQQPTDVRLLGVRSHATPAAVAATLREALTELAPGEHVYRVDGVRELLAGPLARPRFVTSLLGGFGMAAVLLAAVGLYGLMGYLVERRTREIGVRRALGARSGQVRRMVLGQGARLAAVGAAAGLAAASVATSALRALLFEVSPTDPATFAVAAALVIGAAVAACWAPARRATRVQPVEALRSE